VSLLTNISILLNIFPTSALHPTSKSVLSAIFDLSFIDSETSKTIACAIVSSRLDYINSILTGISSSNIHRLQHVQNSLARVLTRSTTNTTSALNSLHGFQFSNESILNWLLLSTIHSTTLALNTCRLYYILTRHRVGLTLCLPPSISSPTLVSTLLLIASRGFRQAGPSLWNSLPHHLRSTDS